LEVLNWEFSGYLSDLHAAAAAVAALVVAAPVLAMAAAVTVVAITLVAITLVAVTVVATTLVAVTLVTVTLVTVVTVVTVVTATAAVIVRGSKFDHGSGRVRHCVLRGAEQYRVREILGGRGFGYRAHPEGQGSDKCRAERQ
jgi:hypothetical protein